MYIHSGNIFLPSKLSIMDNGLSQCVCYLEVPLYLSLHPETRQAISKLLQSTAEPKSADVRRVSQKVITALFDLNPATFSLMLRSVPKILQEIANKILKVYMQVLRTGFFLGKLFRASKPMFREIEWGRRLELK